MTVCNNHFQFLATTASQEFASTVRVYGNTNVDTPRTNNDRGLYGALAIPPSDYTSQEADAPGPVYITIRGHTAAAPATNSGYYQVGDIVFNTTPTAGGFVGWVCVTAGNPGTWKTFGPISA